MKLDIDETGSSEFILARRFRWHDLRSYFVKLFWEAIL